MITRLTLKNFKSIGEQTYDFTAFDLLVGRNNSGKSTILQALAIWQFCVDEFHLSKRGGSKGIQIVLPNFTALPVPEFNMLWKDRTDRAYPTDSEGKRKQEFIIIEILVAWRNNSDETEEFGVELRYHSPQTIYAIPQGGWPRFRDFERRGTMPKIAYVPPFSGLEPSEKWLDVSPIRQQVGKGQPGSVLRNLLLRVSSGTDGRTPNEGSDQSDWIELAGTIERWFSVEIQGPVYEYAKDVYITVQYRQNKKDYDIIAGGSGFHQALTLLAFLYGYQPTTMLLDEPDAHLHVNLQRELLDFFKRKSHERGIQFLIATHAEEFARGVDPNQIVSLLSHSPRRIEATPNVLKAMADVTNEEIARLMLFPFILYVEGETDERILRAWSERCGAQRAMENVCFKSMGGGDKRDMKKRADEHYEALREIVPGVRRLMLFDFDDEDRAFHPAEDNPSMTEWKRKNIENYLLVPEAWRRSAARNLNVNIDDLFFQPVAQIISNFFSLQNLTLPSGQDWKSIDANIFQVVDGKRILFEQGNALFQQLRSEPANVQVLREQVAMSMTEDEIHHDVHKFFEKLLRITQTGKE